MSGAHATCRNNCCCLTVRIGGGIEFVSVHSPPGSDRAKWLSKNRGQVSARVQPSRTTVPFADQLSLELNQNARQQSDFCGTRLILGYLTPICIFGKNVCDGDIECSIGSAIILASVTCRYLSLPTVRNQIVTQSWFAIFAVDYTTTQL
jgi:hypothetical protein